MTTKTAERNMMKAIKARLKLNDRQATAILSKNWFLLPEDRMDNCVAVVSDDRRHLNLYAKGADGYHYNAVSLDIDEDDLARWNVLSLEEAYAMPEGFITPASNSVTKFLKVVSANESAEGMIEITLTEETGETIEAVMEPFVLTGGETIEMLTDQTIAEFDVFIEMTPIGARAEMSKGRPIINNIRPMPEW